LTVLKLSLSPCLLEFPTWVRAGQSSDIRFPCFAGPEADMLLSDSSGRLLPSRYDQAVASLGAHGELVRSADELQSALERAFSCGRPACVNVMIEQVPAPVIGA